MEQEDTPDTQSPDENEQMPTATPASDKSEPAAQPDTEGPPAASADNVDHAEDDQLPVTGAEGGVVQYGTGKFAPSNADLEPEPRENETVVADAFGHRYAAPLGRDGVNAVSVQNPLPGAVRV